MRSDYIYFHPKWGRWMMRSQSAQYARVKAAIWTLNENTED